MVARADGKHLLLKLVAPRQLSEMSCELPISGVVFSCQNSLCCPSPPPPPPNGTQAGKEKEEWQQAVRKV